MLSDFLAAFDAHLSSLNRSPRTRVNYRAILEEFFGYLGRTDPAAITEDDFLAWDRHQAADLKVRHNTRIYRRATLRTFWKFLHDKYGIDDFGRRIPQLKLRISDPHIVHPEQLVQILHAQDESEPKQARDAAIIAFICATGVRREELYLLNMNSIELRPDGKQFQVLVRSVKPDERTRLVIFGNLDEPGDIAAHHFGLWFMNRILRLGGAHLAGKFPLISDCRNDRKRLTSRCILYAVKAAVKRVQIPGGEKINVHSFRHFYATWSYINGMDLKTLAHYLGHASTQTTERYIHLAEAATGQQALQHSPLKGLHAKPSLQHGSPEYIHVLRQLLPRART